MKKFFQPPKYSTSDPTNHVDSSAEIDEFNDGDDDVYEDNSEDYADLLHPVQVLRNHLRLIHVPVILHHIWT